MVRSSGWKSCRFALVAVLVVGYILLIGPGDYYLVNKVFKRPEITWISFPLTVIGVSAAAYWYANWQKGDELRVNQVEFVDVDATTGFTRGTVWTHFFTPQVAEFDLSLQPAFLKEQLAENERTAAWLGQPGYGLGGMQAGSGQTGLFDHGYTFDTALDKMLGVPVQLWSTKTITSRWSSKVDAPVDAKLNRTDDQLVLGQIVNNSDDATGRLRAALWPMGMEPGDAGEWTSVEHGRCRPATDCADTAYQCHCGGYDDHRHGRRRYGTVSLRQYGHDPVGEGDDVL